MVGDILDGFLRLGLCACPVRRPHAMQARRSAFCPDILLQETDLIGRNEELVIPAVLDVQIVAVNTGDLDGLHAQILPDAVGDMHHVVAGRNLSKVTDAFPRRRRTAQPCLMTAEDILLRQDGCARRAQLKART